jgi:IclR family transcriptional regulator, KDG regulon repressor
MRRTPALTRAFAMLELLRVRGEPLSAAELAAELALPRTTAHELIGTLLEHGYLEADDGPPRRYRLGLRLFELGNAYASGLDLAREARPVAAEIASDCEETVHVAIRDGTEVVYIAKVDSTHSVRMVSTLGGRLPAHLTAVGKMLLSAVPGEELAALYPPQRELAAMTPASIRTPARLRAALDEVRREGLAWDNCESNAAVNCVAAPVRDHRGETVAAISISVPTPRWSDERAQGLARLVRTGAERLSTRLGARVTPRDPA